MPLFGTRGAASVTGFGGLAKLGYLLRNSLRFRNSASAYLNRTGGTSTSRRIHTFSFWTKSSVIGGTRTVISAGSDDSNREVIFIDSNKFTYQVKDSNNFYDLESTQVFRDPAAWYHFVVAVDTTQATGSNRVKVYVNGSQITAFGTAVYPPQNDDLFFNDSVGGVSYIGALRGYLGSYNYDGYFTEFNFIDGQALTPSSFGKTDPVTGQWIPIKYGSTYGTNGFYLPFTNTTSTSTLGNDFSGNGNTWTVNGISLTTGSTYDSMTDVPTLTSATAANYATLNPINLPTGATTFTYSNGNLSLTTANGGSSPATESSSLSTIQFPSTGKFYAEMTIGTTFGSGSNAWPRFGVAGYGMGIGGYVNFGGSSYGTFTTGDVIKVAWDAATGYIWWGKNDTWLNSGVPESGTGYISTFTYDSASAFVQASLYTNPSNTPSASVNFGQQPFAYTPPSGFKNLNTFNLP
jgi:hypothetical protein